jgi:hypothetical protein
MGAASTAYADASIGSCAPPEDVDSARHQEAVQRSDPEFQSGDRYPLVDPVEQPPVVQVRGICSGEKP